MRCFFLAVMMSLGFWKKTVAVKAVIMTTVGMKKVAMKRKLKKTGKEHRKHYLVMLMSRNLLSRVAQSNNGVQPPTCQTIENDVKLVTECALIRLRVCLYMYVCMNVYVYRHVCMVHHERKHVYVYGYVYMCMYMDTCICVCIHAHIHSSLSMHVSPTCVRL